MDLDLDAVARERFQIEALHPYQRDAIGALLPAGGRVLLVAPTGGGKSLCYQLPAVVTEGTTLVVSPLISLMEDQVRGLEARGVAATYLASNLPREEAVLRLTKLRRREWDIVYVSPERLAFDGFLAAAAEARIALVAIDEAHCIVQWGHDFRPDYLRIGGFLERCRPARMLACTATATPEARAEILSRLGWPLNGTTVVLRGFARPNLHLAVEHVAGPKDALVEVERALRSALLPGVQGAKKSRAELVGAGIVYAATRKNVERLAADLSSRGFQAKPYHAGLDSALRTEVSSQFAERRLDVVVATNAFGMGIDRPDVRVVVHAQPPASLEAYYQEVGRAGRDGKDADGLLLLAPADVALRRRLCELGEGGEAADPTAVERSWALFRALLSYIDASSCRHDAILRYFGDEAESLGGCGHCDVCLDPSLGTESGEQALDAARRALAGVARVRQGAGLSAIAAMLRGQAGSRVSRLGLDRLTTFGVLGHKSEAEVDALLRALVAAGWLDFATQGNFALPFVTRTGWAVMTGQVAPPFRAPRVRRSGGGRSREATTRSREPRGRSRGASTGAEDRAGTLLAPGDAAVFEALRARRAELAKQRKVPAYVVAHDSALRALAAARPRSRQELLAVDGFGERRVEAYGDDWLEVIERFD